MKRLLTMMGLMTMIRITMTMVKMMRLYLQRLGSCEECAGGNKSGKVTLKSKNGNTHNTLEKEVTAHICQLIFIILCRSTIRIDLKYNYNVSSFTFAKFLTKVNVNREKWRTKETEQRLPRSQVAMAKILMLRMCVTSILLPLLSITFNGLWAMGCNGFVV